MSLRICSFVSRLPVRPQGETRSLQTALWKDHRDARRAQARQAMMGQSAHTFPSHLPATPQVVPAWQDALEWCPSTVPFQPESPLWPQPTALPCWSWGLSPSHRPSQGTERAAGIPALRNPEHAAGGLPTDLRDCDVPPPWLQGRAINPALAGVHLPPQQPFAFMCQAGAGMGIRDLRPTPASHWLLCHS